MKTDFHTIGSELSITLGFNELPPDVAIAHFRNLAEYLYEKQVGLSDLQHQALDDYINILKSNYARSKL